MNKIGLDEFIKEHQKNEEKASDLVTYLYQLMDLKKIESPELYKKINLTRQAFSKIISGKTIPSLNTLVKIVLALELSNTQCKKLLKKAGYTLSSSSTFSLVIRYCLENQIYSLIEVNDLLVQKGLEPLE